MTDKELSFKHYVLIGLFAIIALILIGALLYLIFAGPNWFKIPFWIIAGIVVVILLLALIGYWVTYLLRRGLSE